MLPNNRFDPHSNARIGEPKFKHVQWSSRPDFDREVLECTETMFFDKSGDTTLDTKDIDIVLLTDPAGKSIRYALGDRDPILGSPLQFTVDDRCEVRAVYRTQPEAAALCWMKANQTEGGKYPFLASKSQHDNGRSFLLCRDTASERFTFEAELHVPRHLRGLMAARSKGDRQYDGDYAIERWEMPFTIPSYLFTLFVGDVRFKELSHRCGVWAEPSILEKVAWELEGQEQVLQMAEGMLTPYEWGRYDIIVVPKFYPSAGMENPMLTSISQNMFAGNRQLMYVQDHETIHPWLGNRTTHANAEHYVLNEGLTEYYEGRITEKRYGMNRRFLFLEILRLTAQRSLQREYQKKPHLARLRPVLQGEPAAQAMSILPYFKGAMLMYALEKTIGQDALDAFMREYVQEFPFRSITTEEFLECMSRRIPQALEKIRIQDWLETTELVPPHAPRIPYEGFRPIVQMATLSQIPNDEVANNWSIAEWNLYLQTLERPVPETVIRQLDGQHHLSQEPGTTAKKYRFLEMAIASGNKGYLAAARMVLSSMGNRGIAGFLFGAMAERREMHSYACETYEMCKPFYHATARADVEKIFKANDVAF